VIKQDNEDQSGYFVCIDDKAVKEPATENSDWVDPFLSWSSEATGGQSFVSVGSDFSLFAQANANKKIASRQLDRVIVRIGRLSINRRSACCLVAATVKSIILPHLPSGPNIQVRIRRERIDVWRLWRIGGLAVWRFGGVADKTIYESLLVISL
jgi:hypothetical protein